MLLWYLELKQNSLRHFTKTKQIFSHTFGTHSHFESGNNCVSLKNKKQTNYKFYTFAFNKINNSTHMKTFTAFNLSTNHHVRC